MNDPEAHAVSLTNLADTERSSGKRRVRNAMLVADPTYHANREGLPGRALQTIAIEQGDDLFIIMSVCQSAYFVNERVWITKLQRGSAACVSQAFRLHHPANEFVFAAALAPGP